MHRINGDLIRALLSYKKKKKNYNNNHNNIYIYVHNVMQTGIMEEQQHKIKQNTFNKWLEGALKPLVVIEASASRKYEK